MLTDPQRQALDDWARAVVPRALVYARSLTRDHDRAADVVQECLLRLLRRASDYDLLHDGVKLLFRAITNLCINQTTRARTVQSLSAAADGDCALDPPDPAALSPERLAMHRELQTAVAQAMQQLPELQRAALELRALGQGKAEIAAILDVSPTHAGVLVHRARQALTQLLGGLLERPG